MKREDVVRLRELLAKATPGPWRVKTTGNIGNQIEAQSGLRSWERDDGMRSVCGFQYCGSSQNYYEQKEVTAATGELIAEAVNALPALLALAEAVEGLTNDLNLMNEQGETPDGDGITVNVQLWAERWLGRLVAAPEGSEGYARG